MFEGSVVKLSQPDRRLTAQLLKDASDFLGLSFIVGWSINELGFALAGIMGGERMGTVCFRKQFHVSSACKNLKLKSSHDWKAKLSGWGPSREMSGVCWGSLTPLGDRRSGWWRDKCAPLWACFYFSEATLPVLLLGTLDLLAVIPKGCVLIVICAHVEALARKGSLSTSHEWGFCLSMTLSRWSGMCSAGSCGISWCCCGPLVFLPIWARPWGDVSKSAKRLPWSQSSPVAQGSHSACLRGEQRDCSLFLSPGGCVT